MKYVLGQREGFKEEFFAEVKVLKELSSEELVQSYNREVELGIVGVYGQAIRLVALGYHFRTRFNQSPVQVEDNIIISLTGKVKIVDDSLCYLNDVPV
jgi:hypothetical protein